MRLPRGQLHKPSLSFQLKPPSGLQQSCLRQAPPFLPIQGLFLRHVHIPSALWEDSPSLFLSRRKFRMLNSMFQFCRSLSTHHDEAIKALQIFDRSSFVKNLRWRPRKNSMTAHGKLGLDFKELVLPSSLPRHKCQGTNEESPLPLRFFSLS